MKKPSTILAAVFTFSTYANAHYAFGHLVVNDTFDSTQLWKYVRKAGGGDVFTFPPVITITGLPTLPTFPTITTVTALPTPTEAWESGKPGAPMWPILPPYLGEMLRSKPLTNGDITSLDLRCGRDGWKPFPNTATADVLAGDRVGFRPEVYNVVTFGTVVYDSIAHIGPGQAYLAKKPDGVELSHWDGDGDWFKIDYTGPKDDESWILLGAKQYNVTIPKTTPPGEYLLRVEHLYPSYGNTSEFFVNCAQINIIGPGGGTPKGFARFPGTYKPNEPALSLPEGEEILNGTDPAAIRWKHGFLSYVPPGPPVWTG